MGVKIFPTIEQVILHRTILKAQPYLIEFVIKNDSIDSYQRFLSFAPLGFVTGYEARELLEAYRDIAHETAESAYLNFGKYDDPIMKKLNKFVLYKRGLKNSDVTPWNTTTKEATRIIQTDFNWILWPKPTQDNQDDSVDDDYSELPPSKNAICEPDISDCLTIERTGELVKFEYKGKESFLKKKHVLDILFMSSKTPAVL